MHTNREPGQSCWGPRAKVTAQSLHVDGTMPPADLLVFNLLVFPALPMEEFGGHSVRKEQRGVVFMGLTSQEDTTQPSRPDT